MKKCYSEVREILSRCTFPDRRFVLLEKRGMDGFFVQIQYAEPDIHTGRVELQKSRKWYISPWMTETEIVETAFAAIQRSMMHVVGEYFLYRGERVYSPHFTIEGRLALSSGGHLDKRPDDREVSTWAAPEAPSK